MSEEKIQTKIKIHRLSKIPDDYMISLFGEPCHDYLISTSGNIFSLKHGRKKKLSPFVCTGGYRQIRLSVNGKGRYAMIHILVAVTFIPNPENKPEINHINFDREDNRVENLEWVTTREQAQRKNKSTTSSKYHYVYRNSLDSKWGVGILVDGRKEHVGLFCIEEEAARAADKFIKDKKLVGYVINFP